MAILILKWIFLKKGGIILEAEKFDLAYFKQRIPDFPLSGRVKGKLRVDFEPELTIKLTANSGELKLDGIPLNRFFSRNIPQEK